MRIPKNIMNTGNIITLSVKDTPPYLVSPAMVEIIKILRDIKEEDWGFKTRFSYLNRLLNWIVLKFNKPK